MNQLKKIKDRFISKNNTEIRRRIIYGAYWNSISAVLTRSITTILSFLLANILGNIKFGEYGVINNTNATIAGFAGLGLGATITRYLAYLKKEEPERAGKIIGLISIVALISSLFFAFLSFFIAPWLAKNILEVPRLSILLQISSITMGLSVLNNVQNSILTGLEEFKISSIIISISAILQSLLVVIMAFLMGVKGAMIALSISSFLTIVAYYFVTNYTLRKVGIVIEFKGSLSEWKVLIHYSLPAFLNTITIAPAIWFANILLVNQSDGYGSLGIYNAALQWEAFLNFIPVIISSAVFPIMSDMYGLGNGSGSVKFMWKMMKVSALIIIPSALLVSFASPFIINIYGDSFKSGSWVVVIIAITTIFTGISIHLGTFIMASGKMWYGFVLNLIWSAIFLILSFLMVKFGAIGLAGARFIAYLIHFILSIYVANVISTKYKKNN